MEKLKTFLVSRKMFFLIVSRLVLTIVTFQQSSSSDKWEGINIECQFVMIYFPNEKEYLHIKEIGLDKIIKDCKISAKGDEWILGLEVHECICTVYDKVFEKPYKDWKQGHRGPYYIYRQGHHRSILLPNGQWLNATDDGERFISNSPTSIKKCVLGDDGVVVGL